MEKRKIAFQVIILFGLVSLFGDMVYEGARSVNGPYLKILSANAVTVGLIAGFAEFIGYIVRLASGYFADKTKAYWLFTFLGYGLLISVPLLGLAGAWQVALVFIILERLGKALRSPARDTILSQATKQVGTGFGFAIAEALDQVGAVAGPLIFAILFISLGSRDKVLADYQQGYSLLWIPFILVMLCVLFAYKKAPDPEVFETNQPENSGTDKLSRVFWLYTIFSFITTLGFANFVLIGYHFKAQHVIPDAQIPLFYAIAMGVDATAALAIGKLYDIFKNKNHNEKAGLSTLIIIPVFSAVIPLFAFSRSIILALISVLIWGLVMGAHETIMKSVIADLTTLRRRGTGYGIFNTAYGLAIFIGTVILGFLYEKHIASAVIFIILVQIIGVFMFFAMHREAVADKA